MMDHRNEDSGLKKAIRRARKSEALREAQRTKFVQVAMGTTEGKEYFRWLLEITKIGHQPFVPNALAMSFNCGELNIGQQIMGHFMDASPEGFIGLLKENADERSPSGDPDAADTGDDDPGASDLFGERRNPLDER